VEAAKRLAAYAAVDDHIDLDQKVCLSMGYVLEDGADDRLSALDQDRLYPTSLTELFNKV
jgi:hypothetical protein